MNKKKKFLGVALFLVTLNSYAEDKIKTFVDSEGDNISCQVNKTGETSCVNSHNENVICANTDKGYSCSSN